MTGVTAWLRMVNVGVGTPLEFLLVALNSWVNATVHTVVPWVASSVPGLRYADVSPPWPWYQTMSTLPAAPASIHGKRSAWPGLGVVPVLSVLICNALDQLAPRLVENAYCTL